MQQFDRIPIQNIYYLLCYAWNKIEEQEITNIQPEDFKDDLVNLFAKVLINGTKHLLKRGLNRDYFTRNFVISGIKGKLNISDTIKQNLFIQMKASCDYDEFEYNTLHNRILISTFYNLLKTSQLTPENHKEIKTLIFKMPDIEQIQIKSKHFLEVRLNRNNQYYKYLLKICELFYYYLLPTEQTGQYLIKSILRDKRKMAHVFEEFLRNFFKLHKPEYIVGSKTRKWKFIPENQLAADLLPKMITDIELFNDNRHIIIDAKYYRSALAMNPISGKEKLKSSNLYQIFSYLINQESDEKPISYLTEGMLLYPAVEHNLDLKYTYESHQIRIKSIDLNQNWKSIEEELLALV